MIPTWAIPSVISISMLFGGALYTGESAESYWVGKRFSAQQCVLIEEGRHQARRKLCTITYDVRKSNTLYRVDGHMEFKETYVPPEAHEVEFQVLLIDEGFVCRKQLNMRSNIEKRQAKFSFVTEQMPINRYVRTYFVVHYR